MIRVKDLFRVIKNKFTRQPRIKPEKKKYEPPPAMVYKLSWSDCEIRRQAKKRHEHRKMVRRQKAKMRRME